jgi:hypothetical protein
VEADFGRSFRVVACTGKETFQDANVENPLLPATELGLITETDFRTTSPIEVFVRILREFFEPAERT